MLAPAVVGLRLTVHGERLLDSATYLAIVVTVMLTTFLTSSALKWRIAAARQRRAQRLQHAVHRG